MIRAYLRFCQSHSAGLLGGAALLTLLLAIFTYPKLSFTADRQKLFRATDAEQAQRQDFERRFGGWNDLSVVLDGGSVAEREKAALALGQKMSGSPLFQDVRASVDLPGLERQALYFLSNDELAEIDRSLATHAKVLGKLSRAGWYGFLESADKETDAATKDEQRERFAQAWKQSVEGAWGKQA